jgi:arsenate reductase-like glutaredoxin family protein
MTCHKAQGFLAETDAAVKSETLANKEKWNRDQALALARQARRIVAMKGKNLVTLVNDPKKPLDDATLLAHLLGPTGNLRAPTLRVGKTLLVGFHPDVYRRELGTE